MGRVAHAAIVTLSGSSPLTTGDPVGDLTSYGIFGVLTVIAWRLFRSWRAEEKDTARSHDAELELLRENQMVLLAHITNLSVAMAKAGLDVPEPPTLKK